jgi:hypothetical protein
MQRYWRDHPPLHILAEGLFRSVSGKHLSPKKGRKVPPLPPDNRITTAEQLFSLVGVVKSAGLGADLVRVTRG